MTPGLRKLLINDLRIIYQVGSRKARFAPASQINASGRLFIADPCAKNALINQHILSSFADDTLARGVLPEAL